MRELRESLSSMKEGSLTARNAMAGMRVATDGLPRMSKELNKAKRAVVAQIDGLLSELDSVHSTINNIVEAIDQMLGE